MNGDEHKEAILAAVKAAVDDGFILEISNPCGSCCNAHEVDLFKVKYTGDKWETLYCTKLDI